MSLCLFHDSRLLVVNKPHSLPIDGADHADTLERLTLRTLSGASESLKRRKLESPSHAGVDNKETDSESKGTDQQAQSPKLFLCHQLDAATSGILCYALDGKMAAMVSQSLRDRQACKIYLALVEGHLDVCSLSGGTQSLLVDHPLGSLPRDSFLQVVGNASMAGRACVTRVRLLQHGYLKTSDTATGPRPVSKVALLLRSGRRHQLRVHLASLGAPIVGDTGYNPRDFTDAHRLASQQARARAVNKSSDIPTPVDAPQQETKDTPPATVPRMMLHAWRLWLPDLPVGAPSASKSGLFVEAPDPFDSSVFVPARADDVAQVPPSELGLALEWMGADTRLSPSMADVPFAGVLPVLCQPPSVSWASLEWCVGALPAPLDRWRTAKASQPWVPLTCQSRLRSNGHRAKGMWWSVSVGRRVSGEVDLCESASRVLWDDARGVFRFDGDCCKHKHTSSVCVPCIDKALPVEVALPSDFVHSTAAAASVQKLAHERLQLARHLRRAAGQPVIVDGNTMPGMATCAVFASLVKLASPSVGSKSMEPITRIPVSLDTSAKPEDMKEALVTTTAAAAAVTDAAGAEKSIDCVESASGDRSQNRKKPKSKGNSKAPGVCEEAPYMWLPLSVLRECEISVQASGLSQAGLHVHVRRSGGGSLSMALSPALLAILPALNDFDPQR